MSTITSITHHIISAATKELQEQTKNQIKKLSLSIGSRQKIQTIQEIKQSNEKVQLKIQQPLKYLAEFKKRVYQMREQISKDIIDRYCFLLMEIFALDSFIENKLRCLQKENSRRFEGIIEISYNNGYIKVRLENGLPEGRGVYKYLMVLFMMENLKVGCQKAEEFISILTVRVYDGEFKGGLKEGRGVYKYPSGAVYDGEFKGGKPEGRGIYKYPDGAVYDGEFKGGKKKVEEFISILNWCCL